MHPFFQLPTELLNIIFTSLPQYTLAEFCLTSQQSYVVGLPYLYRHVHIKFRKQQVQLSEGLRQSPFLRHTVKEHTKRITLTCCQSSYRWLINSTQAQWCHQWMPHLDTLVFNDFPILPMECVAPFLKADIKTLSLQYCNLVCQSQPECYLPMLPEDHSHVSIYQLPASYCYRPHTDNGGSSDNDNHHYYHNISKVPSFWLPSTSATAEVNREATVPLLSSSCSSSTTVTSLELNWTDFSPTAIQALLRMTPRLTHVCFGANHNRLEAANSVALETLKQHCPHISILKIGLQQVHPSMLSRIIAFYGPQLLQLDIRCQDTITLRAIAQYATQLQRLTVHAVGHLHHSHQQEYDEWRLLAGLMIEDVNDRLAKGLYETKDLGGMESIVRRCGHLTLIEMVNWEVHDIPQVILHAMAYQRKQQRLLSTFIQSTALSTSFGNALMAPSSLTTPPSLLWAEKASLVLDQQALNDIRSLL